MSYKIIDLPALGRQFNATDIIEVSADGAGSYKANIGDFTLGGTNYIFVNANGIPAENGQAVKDAYSYAAALTPNGNPLSATNRVTILLAPGYYSFDEATYGPFTIDDSFIDFQSLSGDTDVYFSSIQLLSFGIPTGLDIIISGIDTTKNNYYANGAFAVSATAAPFENIVIRNCVGGQYSFGSYSSGFIGLIENCKAGNYSFGYADNSTPVNVYPTFSGNFNMYGTFKNCEAGTFSFISSFDGLFGGTFANWGTIDNCKAMGDSFVVSKYTSAAINYGTISNCFSDAPQNFCFQGGNENALNNGKIINCRTPYGDSFVANQSGFGVAANQGLIQNCSGGSQSFAVNSANNPASFNYGQIINCDSFGGVACFCAKNGTNNGVILNCVAEVQSFCSSNASGIVGDIYRCTLTGGVWTTGVTGGGRVVLGIDATGVVNF